MRVNGPLRKGSVERPGKRPLHKGSVKCACERTFTYGKWWRNVQVNAPLRTEVVPWEF